MKIGGGEILHFSQLSQLENLNSETFFQMKLATKPTAKPELNGHTNTHGGARPGAGRTPKALKYASELAAAENKIMSALPSAVAALVAAAESGDVSAAKYLLDRAFGRVAGQAAAIADDTAIPFTDADAVAKERSTALQRLVGGGW